MTPRALPVYAVAALAALAAAGCQRPREDPDAYAAGVAVQRFNERLPEAYRSGRVEPLAEVAGPAAVARVAAVVEGLRAQGKHMQARQLELTRLGVRALPPAADGSPAFAVSTRERWTYEHRADGEAAAEPREASYRMTYTVVRERDRWIVAEAAVERD